MADNPKNRPNLGFIGLGTMGASMAKNLLRSGCPVSAFSRSGKVPDGLREAGVKVLTGTMAELGKTTDYLFLCVSDGPAVKDVLFGTGNLASSLRAKSVIVDFSTIAPSESRAIAAELEKKDIRYLDAPVTGGDVGARNATLSIMVGGAAADFTEVAPYLAFVGKSITHVGPVGAGQMTKAVNQIAVALGVAAMTEAMVLAGSAGLDVQKTLDVIRHGAAGSWSLENYAPRVLAGDLKPGFAAKYMLKDLNIVANEAEALQLELPAAERLRQLYQEMCSRGFGEQGNHALISIYSNS